jgi:hypothetical protein
MRFVAIEEAVPAGQQISFEPALTHQRFGLDNRNDLQDRWKPSIHPDEEPAVVVGRLSSTPHPAPQDDQLMSEHRILRLKPDP